MTDDYKKRLSDAIQRKFDRGNRGLLSGGIGTRISPTIKFAPTPTVRIIPQHLMSWWRTYNSLLKDGWFDKIGPVLKDAEQKGEIPPGFAEYGASLADIVVRVRDIQKKYDYYQALTKFVAYVSGELGKDTNER